MLSLWKENSMANVRKVSSKSEEIVNSKMKKQEKRQKSIPLPGGTICKTAMTVVF
jgi:hypothetical protein